VTLCIGVHTFIFDGRPIVAGDRAQGGDVVALVEGQLVGGGVEHDIVKPCPVAATATTSKTLCNSGLVAASKLAFHRAVVVGCILAEGTPRRGTRGLRGVDFVHLTSGTVHREHNEEHECEMTSRNGLHADEE